MSPPRERLRVVVTGLIGSIPIAGITLHYLQYPLALRALGHDVLYLEDTGSWFYDPATDAMTDDVSVPLRCLRHTMDAHGLTDSWAFVDLAGEAHGVSGAPLREFLGDADVFLNVTGAGLLRNGAELIPRRAYIDTDPGYVQVRIAKGSRRDRDHLAAHNFHFSFGANIGRPGCRIPEAGFRWRPTRQPLALELWPVAPAPPPDAPVTTVLKWQTYDPVEYEGEVYGLKQAEFLRFVDLPRLSGAPFELAMAGRPPRDDLEALGWSLRDAADVSGTIEAYRDYIARSSAEWSVAKGGYVKMRSGWFSDRSASYLASGRPVVLQSTGYERWLPTGRGLLAFEDLDGACAALDAVRGDYAAHSAAARDLALEWFDGPKVLAELLDAVAGSPEDSPA